MKRLLFVFSVSSFVISCAVNAQGQDSILAQVAPAGVIFGLTEEALKSQRPNIHLGPTPTIAKSGNLPNEFSTFMEVTGLGKAGSLTYWYLLEGGRLVGVMRSKNLVGTEPQSHSNEAQELFRNFAQKLGPPNQDRMIRKGKEAFVEVRADVWENASTGEKTSFIATDNEITIGVFARSGFPLSQILIRPDAQRFPMEDDASSSIKDLVRPTIVTPKTEAATIVNQASPAPPTDNTALAPTVATGRNDEEPAKSAVTDKAKATGRGFIFVIISGLATMACLVGWLKMRSRR